MDDLFASLQPALAALRDSFRVAGLGGLASQIPVVEVRNEDEFLLVQQRLHVVKRLLALRPPPVSAFKRVSASLNRANVLVAAVEQALRTEQSTRFSRGGEHGDDLGSRG
jgi:hypothetical protein